MSSKPFRPLTFARFVMFGVMIAAGMIALLLTLICCIELLFPTPGAQRWLAILGAAWGVLFLGGALAALLRQVYELGKELERIKAAIRPEPRPLGSDKVGSAP